MERKGHIIWIDDEIDHLKPHIIFLEEKGYKITTATNGTDANILNQENRFDLALLDQNMPAYFDLIRQGQIYFLDLKY